MFKNPLLPVDPSALAADSYRRFATGMTLLAGFALLVTRMIQTGERGGYHAAFIVASTWFVAYGVAVTVGALAARWPRPRQRFATCGRVLQAVGAALLAPLTVQLPIVLLVDSAAGFDHWARLGLIYTCTAHVAFAALVAVSVSRAAHGRPPLRARAIYGWTVAVSALPGVILVLPPVLVALTGLPILPFLLRHERSASTGLDLAPAASPLPVAIARRAA